VPLRRRRAKVIDRAHNLKSRKLQIRRSALLAC